MRPPPAPPQREPCAPSSRSAIRWWLELQAHKGSDSRRAGSAARLPLAWLSSSSPGCSFSRRLRRCKGALGNRRAFTLQGLRRKRATSRWKCWLAGRLHPCRGHQPGFCEICKGLHQDLQEGLHRDLQEGPQQHLHQGLHQHRHQGQQHQDLQEGPPGPQQHPCQGPQQHRHQGLQQQDHQDLQEGLHQDRHQALQQQEHQDPLPHLHQEHPEDQEDPQHHQEEDHREDHRQDHQGLAQLRAVQLCAARPLLASSRLR